VTEPTQLLLDVQNRATPTLANFLGAAIVRPWRGCRPIATSGERAVWITGDAGAGKTHLLQALTQAATAAGLQAVCIAPELARPEQLRSLLAPSASSRPPPSASSRPPPSAVVASATECVLACAYERFLASADAGVACDDVQRVAGNAAWKRCCCSCTTSKTAQSYLPAPIIRVAAGFVLADLRSRFAACEIYRVAGLTDPDLRAMLGDRAAALGMRLPDEVVEYLLTRLPRHAASLTLALNTLDLPRGARSGVLRCRSCGRSGRAE